MLPPGGMQSKIKNKEERNMSRKDTKVVHIGDRVIGGGNPILIQSMCNTKNRRCKGNGSTDLKPGKSKAAILSVWQYLP